MPNNYKIAVVGLGYVGLPLSLEFVRAEVTAIGLHTDPVEVQAPNESESYTKRISSEQVLLACGGGD